jgi:acetoin utilization deacetylase AcuC-like enzyme
VKVFYSDTFPLPLPPGHRFPSAKYRMLRDRVADELAVAELTIAPAATLDELLLVHEPAYVHAVVDGTLDAAAIRRIGFPWSQELVERSLRSCGATVAAARTALREGRGVYLAGGTHHAFPDAGSGFCVFNDVAVAARVVQREGPAGRSGRPRVLIVDTDVHQGDGTAAIFAGDDSVFTLSVHGARNFPLRKQESDLDVALPDDTGDDAFVAAVEGALTTALARFSPDFVVYLAGADPHESDRLGRLAVTFAGLERRDELVFATFERLRVPMAVCMGGGYADDIEISVEAAFRTVRRALRVG